MSNLFSNEKINTGRQVELDIAKALSIIFMIFLHVLMVVGAFENSITPTYNFIIGQVLGRPCAAPVFMFCMGVGVIYSRHSQWDNMIKRGINLYLLGILVNIFEFFLPAYVCGTLLGKWNVFPTAGGLLLFCVDILAFAGLAFILMGILKKLELSNKWIIIIAVIMSLIGSAFRLTDFGSDILNLFFANFIGSAGGFSAFPLFNWFIFPVSGIVWGSYFIRANDKGKFFRFWPIFIIISMIYFYFSSTLAMGVFSDDVHYYYFMTTLDALFCIIYAHGNIGLCYYLAKILPDCVNKTFGILSSNINYIYIAQWCFIPLAVIFIVYLVKGVVFTDLLSAILAIFILILSTVFALYYRKLRIKN
ncbi:heparan-alpha-glucosaminide N-acetyltransferase domain-containing protein [Methanobrevibacter sp.]